MTETADELMNANAGLRRLVRRRLSAELPGPRLRGAQVELLRVAEAKPGIGVAAAAKVMHLASNSVSTLVNQLIDQGFLRRDTDPSDRRAARLFTTSAADQRLAAWRAARTQLVGKALAQLSTEDVRAIENALPALRRLVAELDDEGEDT